MKQKSSYSKESDLCADFIDAVKRTRYGGDWIIYPETEGFDIVLARASDGLQIGVEAKLRLNVEVVCQALPHRADYGFLGPDHRAVLVPREKTQIGIGSICAALGITVIGFSKEQHRIGNGFSPMLPKPEDSWREDWHHWCPVRRLKLPEFIPDVAAGVKAPVQLTAWKIKAIKIAIILEQRPVTRADFKALQIDPSRWMDPWLGWLERTADGYVAGARMPDFKAQHPVNYEEIKAQVASWLPKESAKQGALAI